MTHFLDRIPLQTSFEKLPRMLFKMAGVLWIGKQPMSNRLLSYILEERKDLETMDGRELVNNLQQYGKSSLGQRQVFKDYLLSSEIFYIDTELNVAKHRK